MSENDQHPGTMKKQREELWDILAVLSWLESSTAQPRFSPSSLTYVHNDNNYNHNCNRKDNMWTTKKPRTTWEDQREELPDSLGYAEQPGALHSVRPCERPSIENCRMLHPLCLAMWTSFICESYTCFNSTNGVLNYPFLMIGGLTW